MSCSCGDLAEFVTCMEIIWKMPWETVYFLEFCVSFVSVVWGDWHCMFRCTKRSMTGPNVECQFIASWGIILRLALIQHVFPFLHFQFHDEHFIYEIQSSQSTVSRLNTQVYLGCPSQYDQCRLAKIWVLHRSSFHLYAISCPVLPVIISTILPDPRLKTKLTLTPYSEP